MSDETRKSCVIAIDGPAGTGKSTAARRLAQELDFAFLDTGAMYRAIALACLTAHIDLGSEEAVTEVAQEIDLRFDQGIIWLQGQDVSKEIRSSEVTAAASFVARVPAVRKRLVELQRAFAENRPTVTEGRDQGTVVFPDARCKFFLDAAPEERAKRRVMELESTGETPDYEEILEQIRLRDERDRNRKIAPLKPASDAISIDTTHLVIDAVVRRMKIEFLAKD